MKHTFRIGAFSMLFAVMLISISFMPAVSAQSNGNIQSNPNIGKVVYFTPPELKIKENTAASTIVQAGDVLITLKNNRTEKTAVLELENLTTGETSKLNFEYYEKDGKYYTTMHDGQASKSFVTAFDPFRSVNEQKILTPTKQEKVVASPNSIQSLYYWDNVLYTSGYGVKYHHPDYASYGINAWDTAYIQGTQLKHTHYSQTLSAGYQGVPVLVTVLALGGLGDAVALLGQAVAGALGSYASLLTGDYLFDEQNCIWGLQSNQWHIRSISIFPYVVYGPYYIRTGPFTVWDDLGIGNP